MTMQNFPANEDFTEMIAFSVNDRRFCIETANVAGTMELGESNGVSGAPTDSGKAVNYRGKMIPLLDMRGFCNMKGSAKACRNKFLVAVAVGKTTAGLVVDQIQTGIRLSHDLIFPAPASVGGLPADHINAIGMYKNELLLILDLEKLVCGAETGRMPQAA